MPPPPDHDALADRVPVLDPVGVVLELADLLSATLDADEIASLVAGRGIQALGASAGFVALPTADGSALQMLGHRRVSVEQPSLCRLGLDESLPVVAAYRTSMPVLLHDRHALTRSYPRLEQRTDRAALAALPLEVDGIVVGALNLSFAKSQPFDDAQRRVLAAVARLCAQALRRSQLAAQLERVQHEFASTASHELRTPVAAMYGAAVTLQQFDELAPEVRDRLLAMLLTQGDRLVRLVDDLRLTGELELGRLQLDCVPVALEDVVADSVAAWTSGGAGAGTVDRLHLDAVPPGLQVVADPGRLQQVVVNLVDNALKYSPAHEPVRVGVHVVDGGKTVRLRIEDRGPGIASSESARIFEKFYRVDAAHRNGTRGTGLGLFICRRLVDAMDASLHLEAGADGVGTVAVLDLPAMS